jgi:3-isopropylmalate/(R)-2-methylmalate dehydratase large subunit
MAGKTLYDKIWDAHLVAPSEGEGNGEAILYIDLHLIHEVTTPQAFAGLRADRAPGAPPRPHDRGRRPQHPTEGQALGVDAVADLTRPPAAPDPGAATSRSTGSSTLPMGDIRNGIVHVVGPEQGRTQPGMTIVCGDSHTSTHGAFGALAQGIGTSEVEHVLATRPCARRSRRTWRHHRRDPGAPASAPRTSPWR